MRWPLTPPRSATTAFVHLGELLVMLGRAAVNDLILILTPGHLTAALSLFPRKKFPKPAKKCRWNDRRLRVFKSMGPRVGLPVQKSGETHDQNCDPAFDPCDVCHRDDGDAHGQFSQGCG